MGEVPCSFSPNVAHKNPKQPSPKLLCVAQGVLSRLQSKIDLRKGYRFFARIPILGNEIA